MRRPAYFSSARERRAQRQPDEPGEDDVAERMQQRDERRDDAARQQSRYSVSASRGPFSVSRPAGAEDHGPATRWARATITNAASTPGHAASPWAASTPPNSTAPAPIGEARHRGCERVAARLARDRVEDRGESGAGSAAPRRARTRPRPRAATSPTAGSASSRPGRRRRAPSPSRARRPAAPAGTAAARRPRRGRRPALCRRRARSSWGRAIGRCATVARTLAEIGQDDRRPAGRARAIVAGGRRPAADGELQS